MKLTIMVHPSLVIKTIYLVCLINAWESRKKDFLKEIMHFHYMTYNWPCHSTRTPAAPGVMKFTILVDPSLHGHHYYILGLFDLCQGVEEKIF